MNKLLSVVYLLFTFFIMSSTACDSNDDKNCEIPMTFQDMTGLAGCGFLLVLDLDDEERRLEAINLSDFDIVPSDGLEVCGTFVIRLGMASTCMAGEIVELTSLTLKD